MVYDSDHSHHGNHADEDSDDDDRYGGLHADVTDPSSAIDDAPTTGYDTCAVYDDDSNSDLDGGVAAAAAAKLKGRRKSVLGMLELTETLADATFSSEFAAGAEPEQDDDDAALEAAACAADADGSLDAVPELVYFDAAGKAELARLAFAAGGVAFVDTRVSFGDYPS